MCLTVRFWKSYFIGSQRSPSGTVCWRNLLNVESTRSRRNRVHPDSGLGKNPTRQVRGFPNPLEAVRRWHAVIFLLEIDDAGGFASAIPSKLSPEEILGEARAERRGPEGRQVGVANFGAAAESEIPFLKKGAAALEKDSREIRCWAAMGY
jgi:hypothetical protein